jgi:hypothetical protein
MADTVTAWLGYIEGTVFRKVKQLGVCVKAIQARCTGTGACLKGSKASSLRAVSSPELLQ